MRVWGAHEIYNCMHRIQRLHTLNSIPSRARKTTIWKSSVHRLQHRQCGGGSGGQGDRAVHPRIDCCGLADYICTGDFDDAAGSFPELDWSVTGSRTFRDWRRSDSMRIRGNTNHSRRTTVTGVACRVPAGELSHVAARCRLERPTGRRLEHGEVIMPTKFMTTDTAGDNTYMGEGDDDTVYRGEGFDEIMGDERHLSPPASTVRDTIRRLPAQGQPRRWHELFSRATRREDGRALLRCVPLALAAAILAAPAVPPRCARRGSATPRSPNGSASRRGQFGASSTRTTVRMLAKWKQRSMHLDNVS